MKFIIFLKLNNAELAKYHGPGPLETRTVCTYVCGVYGEWVHVCMVSVGEHITARFESVGP